MSLTRKILGNTFWQIFGRIATAFIAFVTVGILTNYWGAGNIKLGQAQYGTYATIYEFLAMFGSLADLGIFTIAVREMSKYKKQQQQIFSATFSLRCISLVVALGLAVIVAILIPKYQGTVIPKGVAIAALGTTLFILSGTLSTILLVHLKMKFHAIALVLGKLLTFGSILTVVFLLSPDPSEASFYNLIWAGVWGSMLTLLSTYVFAKNFISLRPSWNAPLMKELFYMAFPFGCAIFLNTIYFRLDITMMGILLPRSEVDGTCLAALCGDQQAGIYAVAVRIMEVLIILPLYFMNSVLPSLSSAVQEKDTKKIERRLSLPFLFLLILSLPAVTGLFLLAKPIVELITPENFGSHGALKILMAPLLFTFFTTFINFVLIAFGEQKKILWINFGAVILNLILNIYAIPIYGYMGAAVTSLLSEGFILVLGLYCVLRITRFSLQWKRVSGTVLSTIVMGVFTFFVWRYWGAEVGKKALAIVIPSAAVLYAVGLLITKAVDKEMLNMMGKEAEAAEL